jgi:hypothetical protein
MQISRLSDYCFKIRIKKKNILIGHPLKVFKKTKADLVIAPGLEQIKKNSKIEGNKFLINAPGEYEVAGISVFSKSKFYIFEAGGVRFCFLLTDKDFKLSGKILEEMGNIDILFLNLNEEFDTVKALKVIGQLQPSLLIPADSKEIEKLLNKLGIEKVKKQDKLSLKKSNLPEEEMEVAVLAN